MQPGPLKQYQEEHGIGEEPDRSQELIESLFPKVEVYTGQGHAYFGAALFNEILPYVQDCDIVLKLDPDILFSLKDWNTLISFIRETDHDAYYYNYKACTINYYGTGHYEWGVMDADEQRELIAFAPQRNLGDVLEYKADNPTTVPCVMGHHLRGWNKPKSFTADWERVYPQLADKYGGFITLPQEHQDTMNTWLKFLNEV